jgi:hypothetical protein
VSCCERELQRCHDEHHAAHWYQYFAYPRRPEWPTHTFAPSSPFLCSTWTHKMKTQMLCELFPSMSTSRKMGERERRAAYLIPVQKGRWTRSRFITERGEEMSLRTHHREDPRPTKKRGRPCSMSSHLGTPEEGQTSTS